MEPYWISRILGNEKWKVEQELVDSTFCDVINVYPSLLYEIALVSLWLRAWVALYC